ncbi:MAG: hypothetical protein WCK60_02090 [Candidatus Nomurabacteria bacterium]
MKFIDFLFVFFDKLEDNIRGVLVKHLFIYTFLGGTGVVLFWRGVWHMADVLERLNGFPRVLFSPLGSTLLGIVILLSTGLFVSVFIGESVILSGLKREKRVIDKTIVDVDTEKAEVEESMGMISNVEKEVKKLEGRVVKKRKAAK